MRVVVVDPDAANGRFLRFVLTDAGHDAVITHNAAGAFTNIIGIETDAVLMEADLPDLNGFDLCKELRGYRYNGPLMFLTHNLDTRDKIKALNYGADDYLVKPFDPLELLARLDTIARRFRQADYQGLGTVLKVKQAELSIGELTYRVEGREPELLTPTEMRMLECLMRNAQITISRDTLIERTWGFNFEGDTNRVDQYIRRLRKKIEVDPHRPEYLHTMRGMGYVFRAPDTRTPALKMPTVTDFKVAEASEESRKLRYG